MEAYQDWIRTAENMLSGSTVSCLPYISDGTSVQLPRHCEVQRLSCSWSANGILLVSVSCTQYPAGCCMSCGNIMHPVHLFGVSRCTQCAPCTVGNLCARHDDLRDISSSLLLWNSSFPWEGHCAPRRWLILLVIYCWTSHSCLYSYRPLSNVL